MAQSPLMHFLCEGCDEELRAAMKDEPRSVRCPKCGRAHAIPALASTETPVLARNVAQRPLFVRLFAGAVKSAPYVCTAAIIAYLVWGQDNRPAQVVTNTVPMRATQTAAHAEPQTYTAKYTPSETTDSSMTVARVAETTGKVLDTAGKAIDVYQKVRGSSEESHSYDLIIESARIASLKSNGKRWDADDSAPDVEVHVRKKGTFGSSFKTRKVQNDYSPSFREKAFRVSPGDTLEIKVIDKDILVDDTIGEYEKLLTSETLRQGSADWSFGQVNALRVRFEP